MRSPKPGAISRTAPQHGGVEAATQPEPDPGQTVTGEISSYGVTENGVKIVLKDAADRCYCCANDAAHYTGVVSLAIAAHLNGQTVHLRYHPFRAMTDDGYAVLSMAVGGPKAL